MSAFGLKSVLNDFNVQGYSTCRSVVHGSRDVAASSSFTMERRSAWLRLASGTWEKHVLSARGFKRVGRRSEYAI